MQISLSRRCRIATLTAAAALLLSVAACSAGDAGSSPSSPAAPSTSAVAPSSSAPKTEPPSGATSPAEPGSASDATFGAGCDAVPEIGKGSFDGMSKDKVATAASNNPALSSLVTAVKKSGLVDTLNNAEDVTVFAPDNDAFQKMNRAALAKLLASKSRLTDTLTLHVVPNRLSPADLVGSHRTLNGQSITIEGSGEDYTVNGNAKVVCGNIQTANATVYFIDRVLIPS